MSKSTILSSVKRHPVAITIYTLYICAWLCLCYLTYYFLIQDDAETMNAILFYWFIGICIPYLTVNIILTYQNKTESGFYKSMANLIFLPMGITLLIFVEHATIGYFNKGV
jgi:CDP-diglyceride synthetase